MEPEPRPVVPQLRLDDLQSRLHAVLAARDLVHTLLEAVVAIGGNLDLEIVLRKIIETAVPLVQARYGALGVVGDDGRLNKFIPVGLAQRASGLGGRLRVGPAEGGGTDLEWRVALPGAVGPER